MAKTAQKKASKEGILANYKRNDYGRVLLSEQRKLASFPDLLDAQKK